MKRPLDYRLMNFGALIWRRRDFRRLEKYKDWVPEVVHGWFRELENPISSKRTLAVFDWPKELDSISYKYRLHVPTLDSMPYVEFWFNTWHKYRDIAESRYINRHLVWC